MRVRTSLPMRLIYFLQRHGILKHTGEKGLLNRFLRANAIFKHRKQAREILFDWRASLWQVLRGQERHKLKYPRVLEIEIAPSNLTALLELWGKIPLKEVDVNQQRILWAIGPEMLFATYTTDGHSIPALYEAVVKQPYGSTYEGMRVLDIGGYYGETAIFFLARGAYEVACIEPYPPAVERIKENAKLAGVEDRLRLFPVAVGAQYGTVEFTAVPGESSIGHVKGHFDIKGLTVPLYSLQVPARTLQSIIEELGWAHIDVAKVDCEGCEYVILESTPDEILQRIKVWVMEFHQKADPIARKLQSLGYEVVYKYKPDGLGFLRAWLPGAKLPWK
ncbi:MAG: FkbM family methyltransferase [Bacteroidia bacterium]|nr:FkbM family methyltransferase [Bacteroidia bacterium]